MDLKDCRQSQGGRAGREFEFRHCSFVGAEGSRDRRLLLHKVCDVAIALGVRPGEVGITSAALVCSGEPTIGI